MAPSFGPKQILALLYSVLAAAEITQRTWQVALAPEMIQRQSAED
jgi:hypothetical protein